MTDLRVTVGGRDLEAVWTDEAPETRAALEDALPVSGRATRWGDELYFDVPIDVPAENAREVVAEGAIAYWPTGTCSVCSGDRRRRGERGLSSAKTSVRRAVTNGTASPTNRGPPRRSTWLRRWMISGRSMILDGGARVRLERTEE